MELKKSASPQRIILRIGLCNVIYIKQRSGTFDSMIQSTLSALLPSEAGQVWNNYLSSSSDKTFTVDGRRVRIVTALNGGHSQIVVYN